MSARRKGVFALLLGVILSRGAAISGAPANTVLPAFTDIDGNTITAPLAGDVLFLNPGTWAGSPTSYAYQVYDSAGAILAASGTYVAGEPIYNALIADSGGPLHVGVIATNGSGSSSEALSTATSNVALPVITPPALARTSGSGVVPFAFTIAYDSTVRAGMTAHLQVINPDDGSVLQDLYKEITEDELAGSFISYWDGTYTPTPAPAVLTLPTGTQEVQVEVLQIIGGSQTDDTLPGISSGWSNIIAPTDVNYGPELFRDISFDGPNFASGGFWVTANPFSGGSLNPSGSGQLCYQTLAAPLEVGPSYRWILIGNKTGDNPSGAVRISLGSTNGADIRLTSSALANGNFTVAGNFTADIAASDVSLEAAAATFSGSLFSTSLRKIL